MKTLKMKVRRLKGYEKFIGLMGKKKAETVYLETRWGIHTFFMKFPIDVIILSGENKVVKVKKNLKPWRIFFWNPRYYKVVEIASVENKKLTVGGKISFDNTFV